MELINFVKLPADGKPASDYAASAWTLCPLNPHCLKPNTPHYYFIVEIYNIASPPNRGLPAKNVRLR